MSKRKRRSTKVDKNYAVVIIALTVVLAALIVVAIMLTGPGRTPGGNDAAGGAQLQATDGSTGNAAGTEDPNQPDSTGNTTESSTGPSADGDGEKTTEPTAETTAPVQTQPVIVEPTEPAVLPTVGQEESSYEQWLAAGMVMAISMEYPDFELLGIYAASETPVAYHATSSGAYVHFRSGGGEILIHSAPLDAERSVSGTTDLYTAQLGFATFDQVAVGSADLGGMEKLELEALSDLISQSLLVSIYGR